MTVITFLRHTTAIDNSCVHSKELKVGFSLPKKTNIIGQSTTVESSLSLYRQSSPVLLPDLVAELQHSLKNCCTETKVQLTSYNFGQLFDPSKGSYDCQTLPQGRTAVKPDTPQHGILKQSDAAPRRTAPRRAKSLPRMVFKKA